MTGIYRFIPHCDVADRMAQGWRYLGFAREHWSALMWWCCGSCRDGEAP